MRKYSWLYENITHFELTWHRLVPVGIVQLDIKFSENTHHSITSYKSKSIC